MRNKKQLLEEITVRKFMKLAKINSSADDFVKKLKEGHDEELEEAEELSDEELEEALNELESDEDDSDVVEEYGSVYEQDVDAVDVEDAEGLEGLEDVEVDDAAEEGPAVSITPDQAAAIMDLASELEAAGVGEEEEELPPEEEELPPEEEGLPPEGEELPPEEMMESLVKRIASRVAKRLLEKKN